MGKKDLREIYSMIYLSEADENVDAPENFQ
jgi:hypothetical protein